MRPRISGGKTVALVMAAIVIVCVEAYPLVVRFPKDAFGDPANAVYGALNALFAAPAFGGVVATVVFQAEEARTARREATERAIFELFQIFTAADFQATKDGAFRVLFGCIQNEAYARFAASRLFAVGQLDHTPQTRKVAWSLPARSDLDDRTVEQADLADRIMLDTMINLFAMLAQRESSATVVQHCDFAYDW